MSGNRERRVSLRIDPKTAEALDRFTDTTRRKVTDIVHEALHRYLLENDAEYRAEILGLDQAGSAATRQSLYPRTSASSARLNEPSDFPDAGTATHGQPSPGVKKSAGA